jgi:hypothetical protein
MSDLSSLIADQWQPIETAPTHGHVLLTLPNGRVCEGYWGCAKYNRKTKAYDEAWVTSPYSGDVEPTHWMPLPSAPRAKEGENNG